MLVTESGSGNAGGPQKIYDWGESFQQINNSKHTTKATMELVCYFLLV